MQIESLTSHAELTKWLKHVRVEVLGVSQGAIASVTGGPSQSQVSRAESDPEFPLTGGLLRQLGAAFHQLAPDKFSVAAPSLVEAKAVAYGAADPPSGCEARRCALRTARAAASGVQMVLGVDLATDELITGTSLGLARPVEISREGPGVTDVYVASAAGDADAEFDETVFELAAWFQGVTLVEEPAPNIAAMIAYWRWRADSHNESVSVHRDLARRLDPIAGIRTLSEAVSTVHGLRPNRIAGATVSGDHVAWIVLLANMIGARDKISPIEAWERHRADPAPWAELYYKLDPGLIEALPGLAEMLDAAGPFLNPWVDGWAVGWAEDAAGDPVWDISELDKETRISPALGDLLVCGPSDNRVQIESVLRRQQIPSASVLAAAAVPGCDRDLRFCGIALIGQVDTTPYAWAPVGIKNSPYGLLRNEVTKRWRAAQLY